MIILIFVVVAALAVVVGFYAHKKEKERTAALAALAAERGWDFAPGRDAAFPRRSTRFELFTRGHSRAAFHTMRGAIDGPARAAPFQMGDYKYSITRSTGKSTTTTTYRVSYLMVEIPVAGVPDLVIRPEGFMDSVVQALGFDDIDFEDAEFSRMFMVKCKDRRFAYDLCHPRMIEWLKPRFGNGPAVVVAGGSLCFWSEGKRWEPREFLAWTETVRAFFELWPSHLVRDLVSREEERVAR